MRMEEVNIGFSGGGVSSVAALGAFYRFLMVNHVEVKKVSLSGASIGAVNIVLLAAEKSPLEVRDFLAKYSKEFSTFRKGREIIQQKIDAYLDGMLFRDLPTECIVSITPLRLNFPTIITRENSENLTVGEVVALSAALPFYFRPGFVKLNGKQAIVWDGGLLFNPPLKPNAKNIVFSFIREKEASNMPWNRRQKKQEEKADLLFKPLTTAGTLGESEDVYRAFDEGDAYMKELLCI